MRRWAVASYIACVHVGLFVALYLLFRSPLGMPRSSKLSAKPVALSPSQHQGLESLVGEKMPEMGLDLYYEGVHLASFAEARDGLNFITVSPPGSHTAWTFGPEPGGGWSSTVRRAELGVEGASNIVGAASANSVFDRDGDGIPEQMIERIGANRVFRMRSDPWELVVDRDLSARFDVELSGSGPDPFARLFIMFPSELAEGAVEGSWGNQWDYHSRREAPEAEDRAMRALGDSTGPSSTGRLDGTFGGTGLLLNLHPNVVDHNIELILKPFADGFAGTWQFVTDAGIEAAGNATMTRVR